MHLSRRHLLAGLAAGAVAPLAACQPDPPAPSTSGTPTPTATPAPTATPSALPFGLVTPSTVEAVIFDGAFGTAYAAAAATQLEAAHDGVSVRIRPTKDVTAELGHLFDGSSTPPDLVDNSGAGKLPIAKIADQLATLDDVIAADNLEGLPIADTLYSGVLDDGTYNDRLIAINYALAVYGLWYSARAFAAGGRAVPTTWDDMFVLGEESARDGQHLFVWGEGAAGYYQELAIASAIKEGGHDVRRALDNLEADAWGHPAVMGVLEALESCVAEGFVLDGGPYLEAQARWSRDGAALLYPSGAWIAHEMADSAPEDFGFTVAPVPTLTAAPTLPIAAVHAAPTEQFVVPKDAANPAGGMELLRVLLSEQAATEFSRVNLIPTIVRGSVPDDVASPSLASQTRLLADAGEDVFSWRFETYYGLGSASNDHWSAFLRGRASAVELAERLQGLTDSVRNDPSIDRYTVS